MDVWNPNRDSFRFVKKRMCDLGEFTYDGVRSIIAIKDDLNEHAASITLAHELMHAIIHDLSKEDISEREEEAVCRVAEYYMYSHLVTTTKPCDCIKGINNIVGYKYQLRYEVIYRADEYLRELKSSIAVANLCNKYFKNPAFITGDAWRREMIEWIEEMRRVEQA